jgi:molybdate transport system substrate-binding protein
MTDEALHVLSAGAAKAVVTALAGTFRQRPGDGVVATFDAAGAVRARLVAGDPCDVVILPKPMLQALADDGHVARESIASLGRVSTGIAIPHGAPLPAVGNAAALRTTLERASALYCPDRERATAGIHFCGCCASSGFTTGSHRASARIRTGRPPWRRWRRPATRRPSAARRRARYSTHRG